MTQSEQIENLPPHLKQFIVDQHYEHYTSVDHAVWRYVMRKNYDYLRRVAHESYTDGLAQTGIRINRIPDIREMNEILQKIGWVCVTVDGFIHPSAFMEFQQYKVLVIAADIRQIEHIEYTPAPDIIHEAAGHAPIIANKEYAEYLSLFGEIGSRAFSSKKDYQLYEAIRHLSIIKEDPRTPQNEIEKGESEITRLSEAMGEPSEMALIRRLHWWTVEYGLIGTLENPKIYGAGLLSSIGESESCLKSEVQKIPYTIDAVNYEFDITTRQPQLFVTSSFKHLTEVLNEFADTMALRRGGLFGIQKAIDSISTATIELSSGLQISGTFDKVLVDEKNNPIYFSINTPSALAIESKEIDGYGKTRFDRGFSCPIGKIKGISGKPEYISKDQLKELNLNKGSFSTLTFESGIIVEGEYDGCMYSNDGKLILLQFKSGKITNKREILLEAPFIDIPIGETIVSAYSGAADKTAFHMVLPMPDEQTHKIDHHEGTKKLQSLYGIVRKSRESDSNYDKLPEVFNQLKSDYPKDWLCALEILELFSRKNIQSPLSDEIRSYLEYKIIKNPELENLITDGLSLIPLEVG